ncbi:DNA excision repair protein ERCC-6-like 2 isoform X2 [Betta splendens]|uniref:DNA excision repair protein ERCC-6-like 2 isoform X2 n=1 Tax=Betta splendens TaxID=158456 RepID=A0A6P7NI16_BETSP|nr:DNA excision repair protein ERCC-6-like 2 isoform X2 [Betta splendens]XP_040927966.1 DNA excision repair protein ERCC-6-like 2 isoform X2 [Betta splendens]
MKPQHGVTDPSLVVPLELDGINGDRVPYTINRYLRDYQREGIRFIYSSYTCSKGCILGDDMGLGKTVQVIGFLAAVLHKTGTWEDVKKNRPQFLQSQMPSSQSKPSKVFLIVAPLSVLYNWKDELDTWGHFQCVVIHGLRKEEELARIKKGRIEIALTTYETLRLCLDQFNNIDWSAVVVDEAHKIKNPNSQITQAMKEMRCKIRIGLTGTILQNNLEELWCVMDWAIPGCLGSLGHFRTKYTDPIEQGQRHSATKRALATGRKTVKALARKISQWFLRRTKALIKEQLPKKDDRVVYCSLTDFQQTVYQAVLDTEDVKLLLRSSEKCDCQSGRTRRSCCYKTNSAGVKIKTLYFSYLAILRKVANHAALLQSTTATSEKQVKYVTAICQKVFQRFPDFVQRCKDEAFEALTDPMYSGKMKVLQKLLKYYLQRRDKILLFSLSTKLLNVLENYCMAEGLDYSRLDGTTKSKERVQIVRQFNCSTHINLCLVSTMAGGLGLNFVGANVVVLFDPTWNPANDLQAIDRAYRIGQWRDVTVLRLISLGTVEEVIYLRQVYKQQLQSSVLGKESARRYFEAVQGHGVHKGELFGIKNLFRLQTQETCLTRHILEREGQVEAGVITTSTHTGEEEERKGVSERGDSSAKDDPGPSVEKAKENKEASKIPRELLDFSSGSEEDDELQGLKREVTNPNAVDGKRNGSSATGPSRMSLLHHGFSRLLERFKGDPAASEDEDSPGAAERLSDTDTKDEGKKSEPTSSGICKSSTVENSGGCAPKLGIKSWDFTSGSEREDEGKEHEGRCKKSFLIKDSSETVIIRQASNDWTRKKTTVDKESDEETSSEKKQNRLQTTFRTMHRCDSYSDESEDFELEEGAQPKKDPLTSHGRRHNAARGGPGTSRRRQSASVKHKARSKHTGDIETFTSSEDEHIPNKKGKSSGCHVTSPQTETSRAAVSKDGQRATAHSMKKHRAMSFTSLKNQTSLASKEADATIDTVLGGVTEVVYTHSNQRVVGGSKAEQLISRAAIRDVFERKMYSQLPANQLLDMQESLSSSPPDSLPCTSTVGLEKPRVSHPVTFTSTSVRHTRHTTFIVGETPQAIRRRQLEDMAAKFKFPSVYEFAAEIERRGSDQRLALLRQYYTSLDYPDLTDTVTSSFPQPESSAAAAPSTSAATKSHAETRTQAKHVPRATKRPKHSLELKTKQHTVTQGKSNVQENSGPGSQKKLRKRNFLECLSDIPSPVSEDEEETVCSARGHRRTERGSVSGSGAFGAGGGLGVDRASSSGLGSGEAAVFLNRSHRDTPSSTDLSHGSSAALSKPAAQGRQRGPKSSSKTGGSFQGQAENCPSVSCGERAPVSSSKRSLLTDLIGDTSILDDLFRPKAKGAHARITPKSQAEPPVQPLKHSRKGFWDILNEGNEESINRLTDPAEVQRVCTNTHFSARRASREEEGKSLWRTNEKFLWKK